MKRHSRSPAAAVLLIVAVSFAIGSRTAMAQSASRTHVAAQRDTAGADTLPGYDHVLGSSRDSTRLVAAAADALHGQATLPAPLVVAKFRRAAHSVMIDLKAESLPRIRWRGAGGTVQILADGRRVILARHD